MTLSDFPGWGGAVIEGAEVVAGELQLCTPATLRRARLVGEAGEPKVEVVASRQVLNENLVRYQGLVAK